MKEQKNHDIVLTFSGFWDRPYLWWVVGTEPGDRTHHTSLMEQPDYIPRHPCHQ